MMRNALTGIQPTNTLHIGNFFGALLPAVELQKEHDLTMMVVDLHAITVPQDPKSLYQSIMLATAAYLAAGIDPQKTTVFQQSRVPEHTELGWALETIATMGEMARMTQFKDKSAKKEDSVSVGLFTYPILMAADILLYDTHLVPVGEDQKQHVELARNLAQRFNAKFGDTFIVPEPVIRREGARLKSLQDPTKKMSKSDPSAKAYISILDDADIMAKKIASAVTDSDRMITAEPGREGLYNLLTIFSLTSGKSVEEIALHYRDTGMKVFKDALTESLVSYFAPIQTKLHALLEDHAYLEQVLIEGSRTAHARAKTKMDAVKRAIGLLH